MTVQELELFFQQKMFRRVEVNAAGIGVYYRQESEECQILLLYDLTANTHGITREQQENVRRQVEDRFYAAGYFRITLLNLVLTAYPSRVQELFGAGESFWILDIENGRVMLYEDQQGDFGGLRKPLEELLYAETLQQRKTISAGMAQSSRRPADDRKDNIKKYFSRFNTLIIVINILVFLYCEIAGSTLDTGFLLAHGALYAEDVLAAHEYYRLFTYMFLHGGIEHLLNNMLILVFIGDNLERTAGHIIYLLIYFGTGIIAGIVSMSYNSYIGRNVVCVGASGAIFGVVGALAWVILVNRGRVENLTTRQMIMFIALSLYGGFTSQGVDNAAHIGGLAAGFLMAVIFYHKPGRKRTKRQKRGQVEG